MRASVSLSCQDTHSLPSELPLGEYEPHERDVRRHSERSKTENDCRFRRTSGMALEHATAVRCVRCRAAPVAKIRPDHGDC